jgi:hypothetical protein
MLTALLKVGFWVLGWSLFAAWGFAIRTAILIVWGRKL